MWARYRFFEKGIGPAEFEKAKMKDIMEIFKIKSVVDEKINSERKIAEAVIQMQYG